MSIEQVQQKLVLARQNQVHFEELARYPKLSLRAQLAALNSARSHKAAAELYLKALEYEVTKLRKEG